MWRKNIFAVIKKKIRAHENICFATENKKCLGKRTCVWHGLGQRRRLLEEPRGENMSRARKIYGGKLLSDLPPFG